jgi:alpha-beta hydrolase superfamily lysophospholipase
MSWKVKVMAMVERAYDVGSSTSGDALAPYGSSWVNRSGARTVLLTADGVALHGRQWSAPAARALVVLVHGLAGSSDDPAVVRQAEALRAAGFHVVSYDSRGHGQSEGQCTLGDLEFYDVAAAVANANETGLDVVLVGASMGAVAALRYAASGDDNLAGVVSISAPATWKAPRSAPGLLVIGMARTRLGREIAKRRLRVRIAPTWNAPEPPTELVRRIGVPVAVVHGDQDRYIPTTDAEAIYRACDSPYRRLDLIAGMGHAFDQKAVPAVTKAVEWILGGHELLPPDCPPAIA